MPGASTVPDFRHGSAGPCRTSNTGPDRLLSFRLDPSRQYDSLPPMIKDPWTPAPIRQPLEPHSIES